MSDETNWQEKFRLEEQKIDDAFRSRFAPQFATLPNQYKCQISIHEGWYPLVKRLCQAVDDFFGYDMGGSTKGFRWVQLKEKFGGLRAYYSVDKLAEGGAEKLMEIIGKFEDESFITCEICGELGARGNAYGYIVTRCQTHLDELIAERKARFGDEDE